jgi:ubiquinone/menaquinone biosynthesis C-methylase UbiE
MKCYLCGNTDHLPVKGIVRDNPNLGIYKCNSCGLVFLQDGNHINEEFYQNDGMGKGNPLNCDFAAVDAFDTNKRFNLYHKELSGKKILDFGCGKGSFLTKLKEENVTSELYALEPNLSHKEFLSSNFKLYTAIEEIPDKSIDFITMFHVLEHLKEPMEILNALYSKLTDNGKIIIEVPSCDDALISLYESDAFSEFTYWSCHLYLYNNATLRLLFEKTPFKVDYIKQYQRYSLANHLYWLAKSKPGGHKEWAFLDDEEMQRIYEQKLAEQGKCDSVIAMISR